MKEDFLKKINKEIIGEITKKDALIKNLFEKKENYKKVIIAMNSEIVGLKNKVNLQATGIEELKKRNSEMTQKLFETTQKLVKLSKESRTVITDEDLENYNEKNQIPEPRHSEKEIEILKKALEEKNQHIQYLLENSKKTKEELMKENVMLKTKIKMLRDEKDASDSKKNAIIKEVFRKVIELKNHKNELLKKIEEKNQQLRIALLQYQKKIREFEKIRKTRLSEAEKSALKKMLDMKTKINLLECRLEEKEKMISEKTGREESIKREIKEKLEELSSLYPSKAGFKPGKSRYRKKIPEDLEEDEGLDYGIDLSGEPQDEKNYFVEEPVKEVSGPGITWEYSEKEFPEREPASVSMKEKNSKNYEAPKRKINAEEGDIVPMIQIAIENGDAKEAIMRSLVLMGYDEGIIKSVLNRF